MHTHTVASADELYFSPLQNISSRINASEALRILFIRSIASLSRTHCIRRILSASCNLIINVTLCSSFLCLLVFLPLFLFSLRSVHYVVRCKLGNSIASGVKEKERWQGYEEEREGEELLWIVAPFLSFSAFLPSSSPFLLFSFHFFFFLLA